MKCVVIHKSEMHGRERCARCDKVLDAVTGIGASLPKENDLSICAYCGLLTTFDAAGKRRSVTEAEEKAIYEDLDADMRLLVRELRRRFEAHRARENN